MQRVSSSISLIAVALVAAFTSFVAHASAACGLEYCACTVSPTTDVQASTVNWLFPESFIVTGFKLNGVRGTYTQTVPRIEYRGFRFVNVGTYVPIVTLHTPTDSHAGLGNAVVFTEFKWNAGHTTQFRVGGQVELPGVASSARAGIASNHWELLPYVSVISNVKKLQLNGTLGARTSVGAPHSAAPSEIPSIFQSNAFASPALVQKHVTNGQQLLINPHAEHELLFRAAALLLLDNDAFRPGVAVNGQTVLGDAPPYTYLSLEGSFMSRVSSHLSLRVLGEGAVRAQTRFTWRTGITAIVFF